MSTKKVIRIGTRKPPLAMKQAQEAVESLSAIFGNEYDFQIIGFTTTGDRIQDRTLYDIGGKALFLKEVERALYDNEIDIAVHSLKDVPGIESAGLNIAALMKRIDPRDVLISKDATTIAELPCNAVIGTSSMRRMVFLKSLRPDLEIKNLRGNIITRLQKWRDGEYDAIILAAAGLSRMDMLDQSYCHYLDSAEFIPAVGQGGLALQVREGDEQMQQLCRKLACPDAELLSGIERSFLAQLEATCKTPTSAYAYFTDQVKQHITVHFMLAGVDLVPHIVTKQVVVGKDYSVGEEYQCGIDAAKELTEIVQQHTELL